MTRSLTVFLAGAVLLLAATVAEIHLTRSKPKGKGWRHE